jgi:hypothetical protein
VFQNEELKDHLESSLSISSQSAVVAEWNMNIPGNIQKVGNYRYRQNDTQFGALPNFFDVSDSGNFYTGATDADTTISYGYRDDATTPILFKYSKEKEKLYYSLEDCLKPFRPRSGINKASFFNNNFLSHANQDMFLRPRYYMPHRDDEFKYWRSYRTESNLETVFPVSVSAKAIISIVSGSNGSWTGTVSGLEAVTDLQVNQPFFASPNIAVQFGSGTVGSISSPEANVWTASVTGISSVAGLLVGDQISATSGTGSLFGGSPQSVTITSISGTSITYRVVGGASPTAGTVTSLRTLPGTLGIATAVVTRIVNGSSIEFSIQAPDSVAPSDLPLYAPRLGSIQNVSINTYRTNVEYGISKAGIGGINPIEDAAPFVAYKKAVPANRIVVKLQTNVGKVDLGPFKSRKSSNLPDPFFGESNKTVPQNFKIQYLTESDQWIDAANFNSTSVRPDGSSPIFDADGHLSLEYGLIVPNEYRESFFLVDTVNNASVLPDKNVIGHAYLVVRNKGERGILYIWNGTIYDQRIPNYGWNVGGDETTQATSFVQDLTSPAFYESVNESVPVFREFVFLKGIRLAVESMSRPNVPLELIEISPRLAANLSGKVVGFDISKMLSDMTASALPVGQLIASTGVLELFDEDQAFNANNGWDLANRSGSIVADYVLKNVKFIFYEVIKNVNQNDYYVPIKTLYSEGIPQSNQTVGTVSIELRDFYFYLESITAPSILITEASLSQAVCLLLDSIGFSNYVFKRIADEPDPVVPYFFVAPEQNVAEVLQQLAVATQSAMFFDEYNNFVVMTKEYLLDETNNRPVDLSLLGQDMLTDENGNYYVYNDKVYSTETLPKTKESGAYLNYADGGIYVWSDEPNDWVKVGTNQKVVPANIIAVSSEDQRVYNAGTIDYTARYIQRSYGSLQQSLHVDKTWIYKPVLLWEVSGTEKTSSANSERQEKFALAAMPINTDLSENVPTVISNRIVNNVLDVGENAYWVTRFKGYLYANGEIIRYDAVEYSISGFGNVWLSDNLEYQKYFAQLPFNGKIYPTGLLRIFAEPFYENISGLVRLKNGPVVEHGRGQFGTPVVFHPAGLSAYWSDNANVQGLNMESQLLFTREIEPTLPPTEIGAAGVLKARAEKSQRTGIVKNFLSSTFSTETDVANLKSTTTGTIQSSALVFTGPEIASSDNPRNFVSYVHKQLTGAFRHFGTRMRIIGKVEALGDRAQTPVGGMTYYSVPGNDPTQTISIGGGSGGISLVNPKTNNGYYFEIAAVTAENLERYLTTPSSNENTDGEGEFDSSLDNIMFYRVEKEVGSSKAIPKKLWGGIGNIIVDDGNFVGQYRFAGEENPTVYDLAIEYVDVSSTTRVFYLYINQKLVKTVVDEGRPIPLVDPSIGLFVRGTSKVMFENVYALSQNYASNSVFSTNTPIASIFGDANQEVNASEALTKYALSGAVQKTYLSGIRPNSVPDYNLYFEEFGTIMREAAYFNIKYDRAYPALYAKIAPTFTRLKGYTVSGFAADSYGAEFLVFNNTDTILNLDETTGNYLRILGVTFTQDTTNTITVDDYLEKRGNLADPEIVGDSVVTSPFRFTEQFEKIKISRLLYGKNEFVLNSPYIQDQDTAENILDWLIDKNLRPRKAVGLSLFPNATLQLGDIVNINYKNNEGLDVISSEETRFVVYNIIYEKSSEGPSMIAYLSEV